MKGAVAVQRKLLVLIYKLFVNDTEYDPNYQINNSKEKKHLIQLNEVDMLAMA